MENLRDKMLNAILKKFTSPTDRFDTHNVDVLAEACARVAEEEIRYIVGLKDMQIEKLQKQLDERHQAIKNLPPELELTEDEKAALSDYLKSLK